MMKKILLIAFAACQLSVGYAQKIVAHRGYWDTDSSAQNSIASLQKAAQIGCWGSELDVWITTDGVVVVHHDADIEGIRIENASYAQIRQKTLCNGEYLPTLEQYLWEAAHHPEMKLVLEVKPHSDKTAEDRCVDEVLRLVKKYGVVDQTDYISFSMRACERIVANGSKALDGPNGQRSGKRVDKADVRVFYLTGDVAPKDIKSKGLRGIDYEQSILYKVHPEWVTECHALGLEVNAWTVDDLNITWMLIKQGVDYITTNRPVESLKLSR